jgi:HEAT repeat protein
VAITALNKSKGVKSDRISSSILKILTDRDIYPPLQAEAAKAAGGRCQKGGEVETALFNLLKKGAEPLASDNSKIVAVHAALALGNLGTERAKKYLEKAKTRSNPVTDKAIKKALSQFGKGCLK